MADLVATRRPSGSDLPDSADDLPQPLDRRGRKGPTEASSRDSPWPVVAAIGAAVLVGSILRLRFLHVPLSQDEAGFAEVARLWARGEPLYGDVAWVDRPQGILLVYRLVAATGWDALVRILAILAAGVTTAAVGAAAWALAGRRAAVIAAVLFAVLSPAPHLEGFTANGELLAAAFTSSAVAMAAWWSILPEKRSSRWLVAAGALAAMGPLFKQSAFDALVAIAVVVLVTGLARRRQVPVRDLLVFLGGAALPLLAALVHGAVIGLGDWWFALVGHRAQTDSLIHGAFGPRVKLFRESLGPFWRDLGVLVPLTAVGLVGARHARRLALPLTWLLAAAVGFTVGGLSHVHYWVQLAAPLALLGAVGLDALASRSCRLAVVTAAVCLAVPLAFAEPVYLAATNDRAAELTFADPRLIWADELGRYAASVTEPGQPIAVAWADASVYWYADRPPAFRYMWLGPLDQITGGAEAARRTITGPDPVEVVVVTTRVRELDPDGEVREALARRYRLVRRYGPYAVYRLRSSLLPAAPTSK